MADSAAFDALLSDIALWVLPLIIAITFHEAAHAWAANAYGDDTAKRLKRLTFNPLRHIDTFGTILIPGMLLLSKAPFIFGYAKPVPVNFDRLTPARQGMFMVAVAGPATNSALAVASALLLHVSDAGVSPEEAPWMFRMLYLSLQVNCVLAVLNLLPILPLDGGRMVAALLPPALSVRWGRLERYGFPIIILLLLSPLLIGINLPKILIADPAYWLLEHILRLTGSGG